MAVKSVIQIDVNDADFQRYAAAFATYQQSLAATPAAWAAASAATATAAQAATTVGIAATAAAAAVQQTATNSQTLTTGSKQQASAWASMASNAGKFASRVVEATRSLLRWGELSGLISGILGGGGLFGIDRLAISASQQRSRAFQLSGTPGEVAAAGVDLERFTDPNAFMSNINKGINNIDSPQYLAMMTAGAHPERQTDAASAAFDTLLALKDSIDKIPKGPLFGTTAHAFKYDELMPQEDLIKLRNMSREEVQTQVTRGHEDTTKMELTPAQTRIWNDLKTQFDRVAGTLGHDFIVRLTDLAPALDRLSGSFLHVAEIILNNPNMQKWIDDFAKAIDRFATYLDGDDIKKDIDWLMGKTNEVYENIKRMVGETADFVEGFKGASDTINEVEKAFKILWQTMDDMGRSIAKVAHMIIDPFVNPAKGAWEGAKDWFNGDGEKHSADDGTAKEDNSPSAIRRWWYHLNASPDSSPDAHKDAYQKLETNNALPTGLLNSVERQESGFKDVLSPAGAQGYFQFMPATAGRYEVNPHDEMSSAAGAVHYYKDLLAEFHGDVAKAAAGYNWGEANVEKDVAQYGDKWRDHLPDETRNYVDSVLGRLKQDKPQQTSSGPKFVPNQGRPSSVAVNVYNQTGGNSYISASQLAVG